MYGSLSPFRNIGPLAHRPGEAIHIARASFGKFDLEVRGFGEKPGGRLGKQDKAHFTHGGDELAVFDGNFDVLSGLALVGADVAVQ